MVHRCRRTDSHVRTGFSWLLPAIIAVTAGFAQEASPKPELVTDRPDQTESSSVVPPGFVQVETGWTFTRNQEDGIFRDDVHEFPGTLLRTGVVNRVEFRLGWDGGMWEETRVAGMRAAQTGGGDMNVGAKIYLWEEKGWKPEAAFLAGTTLPVGQNEFSSGRANPNFRIALSHTLSPRFSLGYNLGATWETESDENDDIDTLSFFNYTAVLGIGLTDRASVFVEAFGDIPFSEISGPRNSLDGGMTYLLRDNLQVDASAGVGISHAAADWFVALGITVRMPR